MPYIIATLDKFHMIRVVLINYIETELRKLDDMMKEVRLKLLQIAIN